MIFFMEKNENGKEFQPIPALSFIVEVMQRPEHDKFFIVRGQSPQGPVVMTMGSYKELVQFFDSL